MSVTNSQLHSMVIAVILIVGRDTVIDCEQRQKLKLQGVWETEGYSKTIAWDSTQVHNLTEKKWKLLLS